MATSVSGHPSLDQELLSRHKKLELLSSISALILLASALWCVWPAVAGTTSLMDVIGPAIVVMLWSLFIQDLTKLDSKSRSRLGAATSIAWLPMAIIGVSTIESSSYELFGGILVLCVSLALYMQSRKFLFGTFEILRYRSLMGFVGCVTAISIFAAMESDGVVIWINLLMIGLGAGLSIQDWFGSDNQRHSRKQFSKLLDRLERRILELKSEGINVDQAASLVITAKEQGHRKPKIGLDLLNRAEDDIERSIVLTRDIEDIRKDTLEAIEMAEEIAPLVRRPRSALSQGDREVELGSLRDGESLFRQAKKRANTIIKWWPKAEEAIVTAEKTLESIDGDEVEQLRKLLSEAKKRLDAEDPKTCFEYAESIPNQISSIGEAMQRAEESYDEAKKQLDGTDGLDIKLWKKNLSKAKSALEIGNHALSRGLTDSIVRDINREREAMDEVRRALRQKSKLKKRYEGTAQSDVWDKRLAEIESSAKEKQWSHAATLLERFTNSLDSQSAAVEESGELLAFVEGEWKTLRKKLEDIGVDLLDENRREAEQVISEAALAHREGSVETCLELLGQADKLMEKLRRRV